MGKVEELLKELPPELLQDVEDFAAFLIEKQGKKAKSAPSLKWAGAVQALKDRYASSDLQHKIAEWRIGGHEAPPGHEYLFRDSARTRTLTMPINMSRHRSIISRS